MMRLVAAALLASLGAAQAQTLADVNAANNAVTAANDKTPLTTDNAMFVKQRAAFWGGYDRRESNHFAITDTLHFYIEPVGLKHAAQGDLVTCGVSADLHVLRGNDIIFGREDFLNADFPSHHPVNGVMLNGDLTLTGAPPGNYELEIVVHDHVSKEETKVRLPFVYE